MSITRVPRAKTLAAKATSINQGARAKLGSVKLLSPKEETALVARLDAVRATMIRLLKPVLAEAPDTTRLNHFDQMVTYFNDIRRGLDGALVAKIDDHLVEYNQIRHQLVLANLPWVTKLARTQRQTMIGEDDLFQEGVCGLLKAIDRFEPQRGLRLMTYATWYIREAMQQVRARQSHMVALSSHDQTLLGQMEARRSAFQHEHERVPAPGELDGLPPAKMRSLSRLQVATRPAVSLDQGNADGSIPVPVDDPIHEFDRMEEVTLEVGKLLDSLPPRERFIVSRRFGLDGFEPTSLETLGEDLHVSKERVRQLQRQAIRRMQKAASEREAALVN